MLSDGFWVGKVESSVSNALARIKGVLPPGCRVIVRSIDSTKDFAQLVHILSRFRDHEDPGVDTTVTLDCVERALDAGLFTGFDEVWLTHGELEAAPRPPAEIVFTSDAADFEDDDCSEVGAVMNRHKVFLILADGCGLNYATTYRDLAILLRELD